MRICRHSLSPRRSRRPTTGTTGSGARLWRSWLAALLLFLIPVAQAEPGRVLVLLSHTGGIYMDLLQGLERQLQRHKLSNRIDLRIEPMPHDDRQLTALFEPPPELVIAVGLHAVTHALHSAPSLPILSLLISEDSYNALLAGTSAPTPVTAARSAIYLDQPLPRQLDLLQLILPKVERVAALASTPSAVSRLGELDALCAQRGLQLATQSVDAGSNPIKAMLPLLEKSQALLALPDPGVYNGDNLRAILLTTYHSRIPLLGFSQAYVRAGALAAVHSTPQQIGQQTGDWLAELVRNRNWQPGPPRYPAYYSVSVNRQVAQTLGIAITDEGTLLTQLRNQEADTP